MDYEDLSDAEAVDVLLALRAITSEMDEKPVTLDSCHPFITLTLKGVLDDYSYANPAMSNRVQVRVRMGMPRWLIDEIGQTGHLTGA